MTRTVRAMGLAGLLAAGACLRAPTMSNPAEYEEREISVEAGRDYFAETGGGDPYATGMALPVFLALMHEYPGELGHDFRELADRFGFLASGDDPSVPPVGFHLTNDPNSGVPWLVANCQMCHADRLRLPGGDVTVSGLGNKRVRPHAYASALARIATDPGLDAGHVEEDATRIARERGVAWPRLARGIIVGRTIAAMIAGGPAALASSRRFDAAVPGRMATIESFALGLGAHRGHPVQVPSTIGWAKVPDVVGTPFRETFSYDASGYGSPEVLVREADFLFGARPEWYAAHPFIATSTYLYLRSFRRKLPYPAPVDAGLAAKGESVFGARCASCHGDYVRRGDETHVSYRERVIPLDVVGTDPARAEAVTPDFVAASNDYAPTRGLTRVRHTGGYVPPVLLDVWARGLLGHAGQWPSLEALATPEEARPRHFVVDTSAPYDLARVGVRYEAVASPRALRPGEYAYDGDAPGLRVDGHPFLARLGQDERRAVIEYLKTL